MECRLCRGRRVLLRGRDRRGICWGLVRGGLLGNEGAYQVRRRQVRSVGGQEERIMEWISGGKEANEGNAVGAAEEAIWTKSSV